VILPFFYTRQWNETAAATASRFGPFATIFKQCNWRKQSELPKRKNLAKSFFDMILI
jgi:hypothetical protein